ncbi:MAG: hypothetical protein AAFY48_21110, partial [Bacteroidota bacterium]
MNNYLINSLPHISCPGRVGEMMDKKKKADRREYHREYGEQRRKEQRRITLWVPMSEYDHLREQATMHGYKSLPAFIQHCSEAYLDKEYLVHRPEFLQEMITQIRKIGNQANQLTMHTHALRDYEQADRYRGLRDQVYELSQYVRQKMEQPILLSPQLLGSYLVKLIEKNSSYLDDLEA